MRKIIIAGSAAGLALLATLAYAATTPPLVPVSDGAYTQWTPSTGSAHYALVDESTCNGTTDYNSTNTVGNRDSYGIDLSQIPDGGLITSIGIVPCASKNGNGGNNSTMNVFYRLGGVDSADAGSYSLSGTTPVGFSATYFNGLSITKNASTTIEIGAVLSAGSKGARLSKIYAVITYTPIIAPSNLTATAISSNEIDLGWTDNSTNEQGFVIERQNVTASSTFDTIATTTADVVSYNDTGVVGATTYSYRVRAYNASGYSSYSNTATSTTP
jgi:hypothetical protein